MSSIDIKNKNVRTEQWTISYLIGKINNKEIFKPKFQRKKKWDILPKKNNYPCEKNYIIFLFQTQNSIHPITFGQINSIITNIDGNNRINAICHFLILPFHLFPEYLDELFSFINNAFSSFDESIINKFKSFITNISYNDLMEFKYNYYFINKGEKDFYDKYLKAIRDDCEIYFDNLQKKLKIDNKHKFDEYVKININLFEGYTTEELNKIFENINKYNNKLTEIELLASRLYNITNFIIDDTIIKAQIIENIKEFYLKKNEDEILNCFTYNELSESMNAYDFIVGFQNYCHKNCPIIEETNNDGLSLFFKIYKIIFKETYDKTFTTQNINLFIQYIKKTLDLLIQIKDSIFIEKLVSGGKIFDSCNKKINSLKRNNVFIIIITIIGFIVKNENELIILKTIEKTLLYHFFVSEINSKDDKEKFKLYDNIKYQDGGSYIDTMAEKLFKDPHCICSKIDKPTMNEVINILLLENEKEKKYEIREKNGKDKLDKRRQRKYFEKTLIYYYYKNKIPTQFLSNTFWVEHIFPFSSKWENLIDIDRLGNIIPIIDYLNAKRNNKHIDEYKKYDCNDFIKYVNDIIPNSYIYNLIICHEGKKPSIKNSIEFNKVCKNNEEIYKNNFINSLFQ